MKAIVNNRYEYKIPEGESWEYINRSDNTISLRHNGKNYLVEILDSNVREQRIVVSLDGYVFDVILHQKLDESIRAIQSHLMESSGKHEYRAPIPGVIKSIPLDGEQAVRQGDVLLVLESMKMENTILAMKDSEGLTYHVTPGESVVKGQLLCSQE